MHSTKVILCIGMWCAITCLPEKNLRDDIGPGSRQTNSSNGATFFLSLPTALLQAVVFWWILYVLFSKTNSSLSVHTSRAQSVVPLVLAPKLDRPSVVVFFGMFGRLVSFGMFRLGQEEPIQSDPLARGWRHGQHFANSPRSRHKAGR